MNIVIAGGTGFVGRALTDYLLKKGHTLFILTRNSKKESTNQNVKYVEWLTPNSSPEAELKEIDAFINLAGESINSGRWTENRKNRILSSRTTSTNEIIKLLASMNSKPDVLINASAIGIYGTSLENVFTEATTAYGTDFLAKTVKKWEEEAIKAESMGIRTVLARFGIILGKEDGALPRMVLPYRFFIGGTVGSGKQWLSWVHLEDVVQSIEFAIENQGLSGPINVTAPCPEKMREFGQCIGKVIHRPHWLPAPDFGLKLLLGEMSILVLEGQKVIPEKLLANGYSFSYKSLDEALNNILQS